METPRVGLIRRLALWLGVPGVTVFTVMLMLVGTLAGTARASAPLEQTALLRPSFDMRVPVHPTPVTVAGSPRLVYELHLTNFAREPLVLERLNVLDEDGAVIGDVQGVDLDQRLHRPGVPSEGNGQRTIAAGRHAVLYLELPLTEEAAPRVLEHRIVYHAAGEDPSASAAVRGARIPVNAGPPLVLSPPLRGAPWAAVYHPSWERGHRRVVYAVGGRARIPGRFAIDWFKLDDDGRRARGEEDEVNNWYGYGADVLAVADGVVAATRDDVPESATLSGRSQHALNDASGNYVALDLGNERYAFYEHLKPGSILVKTGDRVSRGQVIGSLGFTGSATGPHLHFHVADANSPLGAEGVPFVLESFRVLGAYDDFGSFGDAPWTPADAAMNLRRTKERPAPNVVVDFGTSETR